MSTSSSSRYLVNSSSMAIRRSLKLRFQIHSCVPSIASGKAERSQNSIDHRSDFILSAPDGIKISHRTIFAFCRQVFQIFFPEFVNVFICYFHYLIIFAFCKLSKSLQKSDSSQSLKPLVDSSCRMASRSRTLDMLRSGSTSMG